MTIRCNSSFSLSVLAVVSMLAACGGEDSYSAANLSNIAYDCEQTAPCDPVFSSRMDSVAECIEDTSRKLDTGAEAVRASYEDRFNRCRQYSGGCTYFQCATDNNLFSVVNGDKLRYECMQNTVCKLVRGEPAMTNDNDICFAALVQQLDFASVPDRATWEQRHQRCGTLMGCDYVDCR